MAPHRSQACRAGAASQTAQMPESLIGRPTAPGEINGTVDVAFTTVEAVQSEECWATNLAII